jgi:hypothetical protein
MPFRKTPPGSSAYAPASRASRWRDETLVTAHIVSIETLRCSLSHRNSSQNRSIYTLSFRSFRPAGLFPGHCLETAQLVRDYPRLPLKSKKNARPICLISARNPPCYCTMRCEEAVKFHSCRTIRGDSDANGSHASGTYRVPLGFGIREESLQSEKMNLECLIADKTCNQADCHS